MKKKFVINLSDLPVGRLANFGVEVSNAVKRTTNEALLAHALTASLFEKTDFFLKSLYKDATTGQGDAIAEADMHRDGVFRAIKTQLRGISFFSGEKGDAAKYLLEIFEKAGDVINMSYAEETQRLDRLISDLQTTKNKALIEIAGLTNEIDDLKESQKTFKSMIDARQDAESDLATKLSASSSKSNYVAFLRAYLSFIWSMSDLPEWEDIYNDIAQVVKETNMATR